MLESATIATSREYRQQAEDCMNLASETDIVYVKVALTEMAADFTETAEKLERVNSDT
jgi:2,3-bisphosphoglycerate-independent phosphoglycerate mutase